MSTRTFRKIRFSVILSLNRSNFLDIKREATECEKLGYYAIWLTDHFFPLFGTRVFFGVPSMPRYECWTSLSAIASVTEKLRLGTLVLCNSYREPSVLAKMASTLDNISNGRLEFGIGAGWYEAEYRAYGIPFERASVRISRLREGVQVIKKMWTEEKPRFEGMYYTIRDAFCNPKPVQKPHPPIWIGGSGEKLLLKVVAELADGCNVASWAGKPEDFKHKIAILENHCSSVGRDINEIQKSWAGSVLIAETEEEAKERIKRYVQMRIQMLREMGRDTTSLSEDQLKPSIAGTPEHCVERIKAYVNAGATHFMLYFPREYEYEKLLEDLPIFAKQVIPSFN